MGLLMEALKMKRITDNMEKIYLFCFLRYQDLDLYFHHLLIQLLLHSPPSGEPSRTTPTLATYKRGISNNRSTTEFGNVYQV